MTFYINQVFKGVYPPEAALWCNSNNAFIEKTGGNEYTIKAVPPPPEPTPEELSKSLRDKRDKLLEDTDKYLISDYPISPESLEEVKAYRVALRELPEQAGFPTEVVFPVMPRIVNPKEVANNGIQ